ncbi:MAG: MFS transporter [Anaerovoracaceae bacterium]|jgi:PPP family 3-phenylpropionic acid transporter
MNNNRDNNNRKGRADKARGGYMGLYTMTYLAIGVMVPLIGQYLSALGFSGAQIGTVTGTGTCVAIFASGFWGKIYANSAVKARVILALCVFAAGTALFITQISEYIPFLFCFAIMYFFQAPIMPLSDAMTLDSGQSFGRVRLWGAVGFATGVFLSAYAAEEVGLWILFPSYAFCYLLAALIIYRISKKRTLDGGVKPATEKKRYRDLAGNKRLWALIASAFFLCGTNVANNTYFSFLYIEGGGTLAGVGLAFLLMAGSEAPFMAFTGKLSSRFSLERMILLAMVLSVFRFAWYSTGPGYIALLTTFFLQGAVNGIILVEFVRYISKLVEQSYISVAVAAYYSISASGSTIVCQLAGGWMLDIFGPPGVYGFFTVFNAIGLMLYLVFGLHRSG